MNVINCPACLQKFTREAQPRILEGCLHLACYSCISRAIKYSEGKLPCGVKDCDNVEQLLDPPNLPTSHRTVGKIFDPKRASKGVDDSQVHFERFSRLHLNQASSTCNLHGQVITHINGSLIGGCDRCLEDDTAASDKRIVSVPELNKILIKESSIVSSVTDQGTIMTSKLKSVTRNLEKEKLLISSEKKKVTEYFDRLHNSLELREFQVVRKIDTKQDESLKAIDKLQKSIEILEALLERVADQEISPRNFQLDSQINLAEVVKRIVEEEEKAKDLLRVVAARNPPNLSIDPNFIDILKSCIYVEEVKADIETPPESSTEDEGDGHKIINQLKEIVVDNSVTHDASLLLAAESENKGEPRVSKRVTFDLDSSSASTIPPYGIIDVDYSQDSSDSNITIDSEVEEDSLGDQHTVLAISVPRFHKVECQVLDIISPSNITVMSSEDKASFHRLKEDLNNYFKSERDRNSPDSSSLDNGATVAVKTNTDGWVRAVVQKSDQQSRLDLIDFGVVCPLDEDSDVRYLASQFLKIPRLAFTIKLDNLIPLGNGNEWSSHAREKLNQLIEEASTVEIEVVDENDEGPYLANMRTKVNRNDDPLSPDVLEEFNVTDVLLEEGLAMTSLSLKKALEKPQDAPDKLFTWRRAKPLAKEKFQCKVEWLDEDCNFYVSPLEWKEERDRVQSLIVANFFRKKEEILHANRVWRKEEACIARYLDNNWYRAEIIVPNMDSNHVGVEFVDFGTKSIVLRVHVSDDIMDAVKDIPILCFPVQLDVKPLTSTWETEVLDKIHLKVEGRVLDVNVKLFGNPFPFIVDMFMGEEDLEKFVIGSGMGKKGYRER